MTTVPEAVRAVRVPILENLLPFYRLCADESLVHAVVVATIKLDDETFTLACQDAMTKGDHLNPIREILAAAAALKRPAPVKA